MSASVTRSNRSRRARHAMRHLLMGATALTSACSWFTDFKAQPKIDPWESPVDSIPPRGNPQSSVPVYGSAAPGFAYGRTPLMPVLDSMSGIPNPLPPDARSLNNGRLYYQINCAVCHGPLGRGDGPATRFYFPGISLLTDITKGRTDGYIFAMIRNGRGLMPTYNRIEESDRWDIVNYIRSLQGKLGTPPDTTHGRPGETGLLVPGPSPTAPTRPAPFFHPRTGVSPVAPGARDSVRDSTRARPATDTTSQRRQP